MINAAPSPGDGQLPRVPPSCGLHDVQTRGHQAEWGASTTNAKRTQAFPTRHKHGVYKERPVIPGARMGTLFMVCRLDLATVTTMLCVSGNVRMTWGLALTMALTYSECTPLMYPISPPPIQLDYLQCPWQCWLNGERSLSQVSEIFHLERWHMWASPTFGS